MLRHLYIKNYALIEELDLDFNEGFSVITGETGAGKSILLGAIGLLLGQRADSKAIQKGATRCVIEAQFETGNYDLGTFFEKNDLEYDGNECILRREITSAGKSRAFINDTPASVAQLKALGEHLVDIHSQHQNLLLSTEDFQLQVLDIIAQDEAELQQYKKLYTAYREAERKLQEAVTTSENNQEEQDYIAFQLQQLEEFNPQTGEDDELQQESELLSHAEEIKTALYQAENLLNGEEDGILNALRTIRQQLQSLTRIYGPAEELEQRIDSTFIELKDLSEECSSQAEQIEYNPERLEYVNARLDKLYSLEQKHHVNSSDALLDVLKNFREKLDAIENSDEHIEALRKEVADYKQHVQKQADKLTQLRKKAAKAVEKEMVIRLQPLGMPNVNFTIECNADEPKEKGQDRVTYYFNANKNADPQPIAHIASGGEIARIMLCLKALISGVVSMPTIIFDEIDTGVSGRIAESMAQTMREMGQQPGRQVISITHLPQIAAMGNSHYRVYKEDGKDKTLSHIALLKEEERINEIAQMLSGTELTQAAIENAKQLIK